jgi:hypothetical protein
MAAEKVKRKLPAIFSADVEGHSRLMGEDELATIETLTLHKKHEKADPALQGPCDRLNR